MKSLDMLAIFPLVPVAHLNVVQMHGPSHIASRHRAYSQIPTDRTRFPSMQRGHQGNAPPQTQEIFPHNVGNPTDALLSYDFPFLDVRKRGIVAQP